MRETGEKLYIVKKKNYSHIALFNSPLTQSIKSNVPEGDIHKFSIFH